MVQRPVLPVITVAQNKGGVGKTTICRLIIESFARHGIRVLAIDLDPQSNLSRRLIEMEYVAGTPEGVLPPVQQFYDPADPEYDGWDGRSSSADIYHSGEVFPYPATKVKGEVEVIPSDGERLRRVELVQAEDVRVRVHRRMAEFLALPEISELYDVVVVDTGPSKGPLTVSALQASSHMILPTVMEPQSIEGLHGMLGLRRRINRQRPTSDPVRILGIIPNLYRETSLHRDILRNLRGDDGLGVYVAPFELRNRIAFAEADHPDAEPSSVLDLPQSNPARVEAEKLGEYVLGKSGLRVEGADNG